MANRVHPAEMAGAALPPPAVYHERRKKRSCSCFCFWFLYLLSIAALVICFLYALCINNTFYDLVPNVEINTLSLDTSQYTATSDISYTLRAHNPNHKISIYYHPIRHHKISIYYHPIRTIVWYKGTELGRSTIPAFYLGHGNTTVVDATISGSNVQLNQSSASNLASELSANSVHLDSETKVKFRLKVGALKLPGMAGTLQCDLIIPKSGSSVSSVEKSCSLSSWRLYFFLLVVMTGLFLLLVVKPVYFLLG